MAQIEAVETMNASWDGLFQVHEAIDNTHEHVLTGFRVTDTDGLFTSLHGVVEGAIAPDRYLITATRSASLTNYTVRMRVDRVNIKEDLAHLVPIDNAEWLHGLQAKGASTTTDFAFSPIANARLALKVNDSVIIEGNPSGSGYVQSKLGTVMAHSNYKLSTYAPVDVLKNLTPRKSPDTALFIIPLQASTTHGESGSPVLTQDRRLIGVIDGGLSESQNWAIPVQRSTFSPANPDFRDPSEPKVKALLEGIQRFPVGQLTALDRIVSTACDEVLTATGVRDGSAEPQVTECLKQSLRANQAGEYKPLRYKSLSQFYLWIQFPGDRRPPITKACYIIESVRPHWWNSWRDTGCPHKGINSCVHYVTAAYNGNLGLVPWIGGEWDPELTVTLEVEISGRTFLVKDVALKDIQFESMPANNDSDACLD